MTHLSRSCSTGFLVAFLSLLVAPFAQAETTFPIANTSGREASVGAAFDGINFLVGVQGDATSAQNITAQFVSKTGAIVGSRISIGATGGVPRVAFDGTNYLLAWECDGSVATCITGQLVSTSGALVGPQFTIATGTHMELGFPGLIFDGTNYFVAWRNIRSTAGSADTSDLLGQFVTTSGAKLGPVVSINTASYEKVRPAIAIAFDGANILAVWADGRNQKACYDGSPGSRYCYETDIYGQFIAKSSASASGTISGGNFLIDAGTMQRDNTGGIGFDGTNYLVTFVEATANPCPSCSWQAHGTAYGILVAKTGTVIGSKFVLGSTTTSHKMFPIPNFLGSGYLVTWLDGVEPLSVSIKGQYVTTFGAVEGAEFVLFSPTPSGAAPGFCVVFAGDGANLAVTSWNIPNGSDADVMGSLLTTTLTGSSVPVNLVAGWNLLGYSGSATMDLSQFGVGNATTVWKWVSSKSAWAFYAPSLSATDLASYAANKGYDVLTNIDPGEGFWVNAAKPFTVNLPR